jgi:hypothetical protein
MFVNFFTVTIPARIFKITIKQFSKEFGDNIPKSLPFEGGKLYFITNLFCVDENINIKEICNKYKCDMGEPYRIKIEDYMYNDNYTICNSYEKEGPRFYLHHSYSQIDVNNLLAASKGLPDIKDILTRLN